MKENPEVVIPRLRPLRYPRGWPAEDPEEKGIDAQLALGMVEAIVGDTCDVAIMFSRDTDSSPSRRNPRARLKGTHCIETAMWANEHSSSLKTKPRVFHHSVSEAAFKRIETPVNYART